MNHVLAQGAALLDHGWVAGVVTAVFLACFLGWTWWAFSARNRGRMNEAAKLPLLEDEP